MTDKVQFDLDPDHAITAFWVTWHALGVAVNEVANLTQDEGKIRELRRRMLEPFLGQITEFEEGTGYSDPRFLPVLRNLDKDALQTGLEAVDSAISLTKFA